MHPPLCAVTAPQCRIVISTFPIVARLNLALSDLAAAMKQPKRRVEELLDGNTQELWQSMNCSNQV
jgi:hypothetical protein